jgi:hypothetical protein
LLLVLPGLLFALLFQYARRPRLARYGFLIWVSWVFTFEALDLATYAGFGRHLTELARFALLPAGVQAAGNASHFVWLALRWLALSALSSALCLFAVRSALIPIAVRLSRSFRRFVALLALPALGMSASLPWFGDVFYHHPDLRERLYKQLVWPPANTNQGRALFKDPNWVALDAGLQEAYANAFPKLFSAQHTCVRAAPATGRPNVVIILVESWRQDSLTPERMPRLSAWSERGLVAEQHYGGSDYSESGMFALLYGRSPLLYHAALDAHEPAAWCGIAHDLGMECSYFSGHPLVWMRREEFLNPNSVDHFVHDDSGDWNQWDRNALNNAIQAVQTPNARPQIAMVSLMSTHFEYQYPAAYERHLPVLRNASWRDTDTRSLAAMDRVSVTNRYLNTLAFMDDLIADAIDKLDPNKNIIVLTGDHGESLGEDGHFGHGYGFPDTIAKVPFAIVGPGIAPSHRQAPSLHQDLLRTLVHALGGHASGPREANDILASPLPRTGLLLTHCSYNHQVADALLTHQRARLHLELGLHEPSVTVLWPEDPLGHPAPMESLGPEQLKGLLSEFETQLSAIYSPSCSL